MAQVFSPNVIEIAVKQSFAGRPAVNVWHMYFDEELGSDTKTAVVEDFRDNWQDHVMAFQNVAVTIEQFDWRSIDPGSGELGTVLPDPAKSLTGSQPGEAMPPNVAFLIKKNTSDRQRGQRDGRSFIVGVNEGVADNRGTVAPNLVSVWNGDLASFYSGITDISGGAAGDRYPVVLATTPASRAPGSAAVVIDSRRITSITMDNLVSTQRDRLR